LFVGDSLVGGYEGIKLGSFVGALLGLEDVGLLVGSLVDGVVSGLIFGDSLVGEYVGIKWGHCCA
jgi:hypothetical protein